MVSFDSWKEILGTIHKNKARTFLTGLSVASGIFILVLLLGAGKGIENGINGQFEQDAVNRVTVWPGRAGTDYKGLNAGRAIRFNDSDFRLAEAKLKRFIEYKSAVINMGFYTVTHSELSASYRIEGVDPDYQFIENIRLTSGRFINYLDISQHEKVAVLGIKAARDLFGDQPCIGSIIMIANSLYKVIGVFSDPGGEMEESKVFLPVTTVQKAFSVGNRIGSFSFTLQKRDDFNTQSSEATQFSDLLEQLLKKRLIIAPTDQSAINIQNTFHEAKRIYAMISTITTFFWIVGILTIISGVVGVTNILLITVKDRTKEIAIRKVLGASPLSIISIIMQESVFITSIAGYLGLVLGYIVWAIAGPGIKNEFFQNPTIDLTTALNTILILIASGMLAGLIPTLRAVKIKPILALNDE